MTVGSRNLRSNLVQIKYLESSLGLSWLAQNFCPAVWTFRLACRWLDTFKYFSSEYTRVYLLIVKTWPFFIRARLKKYSIAYMFLERTIFHSNSNKAENMQQILFNVELNSNLHVRLFSELLRFLLLFNQTNSILF